MTCQMYDQYISCDECPDYPQGYPKNKILTVNVNGKCWMAMSTVEGNLSNPSNFIGNGDISKAWVLLEPSDFQIWLIKAVQDSLI